MPSACWRPRRQSRTARPGEMMSRADRREAPQIFEGTELQLFLASCKITIRYQRHGGRLDSCFACLPAPFVGLAGPFSAGFRHGDETSRALEIRSTEPSGARRDL